MTYVSNTEADGGRTLAGVHVAAVSRRVLPSVWRCGTH
jgi:hypothetical protein